MRNHYNISTLKRSWIITKLQTPFMFIIYVIKYFYKPDTTVEKY